MNRVFPTLVLAGLLAAAPSATAQADAPVPFETRRGDVVSIFSGDVEIPDGVEQRGSVVCVGGDVTIDGRVRGDVVAILGSITLRGEAGGAVTGVLSEVTLDGARVGREVVAVAGDLELRRSTVGRELVSVMNRFERDESSTIEGEFINISPFGHWFPGLWAFLFWVRMIGRLGVFVLLLLLVAVVPDRVRAIADDAHARYVPAFFVGILVYLALLVLITLLSVTIVGIPLLLLAFWVTKWLGIAGLFAAIGRGLGRVTGREPSLLASVLLCFALYVVLTVVPGLAGLPGLIVAGLFSLLFFLVVTLPGVGLVVLTRGGSTAGLAPLPPPAAGDTTPAPQ